jgi:hypothetical protein
VKMDLRKKETFNNVIPSSFLLLWRGFIYSKGVRGPPSTPPEGRGGSPPPINRSHPNRLRSRLGRPRNLGRTGLRGRGAQEDAVW